MLSTIQHPDFIPLLFQQMPRVPEQLPLGVQNDKTGVGLAEIGFGVKARFASPRPADDHSVQVAPVLVGIQAHADVLGKNAVLERVFIPVFLIHGPRIAPFGGAVFLAPAVIAPEER